MATTGLFDDGVRFFSELEQDNSAEFFGRERARYDAARTAFVEVCDGLEEWGSWRVYRAHNDRRFRSDAPPYKTFLGAVAERADGVGAFLRVDAKGVLVGSGVPMPAPDQLERLRVAVADDRSGPELESAIAAARAGVATVHGGRWPALQRVPRGFPVDSPRADLLRWKGVEADVRIVGPRWATAADAVHELRRWWSSADELHEWLGRCVGPSALSAEERFAPRRRRSG